MDFGGTTHHGWEGYRDEAEKFSYLGKGSFGSSVLKEEVICSLCKQTVDVLGDHAACCAKTSDLVHRHNRLRNLVDKICTEGNLAPVMEKKGILGDTPGRRPGDVTVPLWSNGKGLAIDVAVTCPFASHNISMESPCENYATRRSTGSTTRALSVQTTTLQPWCSRPPVV